MAGLALEAGEEGWATKLLPEEARRAAEHVCLDDQSVPEWLGVLLEAHPAVVGPILAAEMKREWKRRGEHAPLLNRAAYSLPIVEPLRSMLLDLLAGPPPGTIRQVAIAAQIVSRAALDDAERERLAKLTRRRLSVARSADDWQATLAHLRLLYQLAPRAASATLLELMAGERSKRGRGRAPEVASGYV